MKKLPTRNSILGIFSRKEHAMIRIGSMNTLQVLRKSGSLTVLDGGAAGEIVLPQAPPETTPGSQLDVFLYHDSENRLTATLARPRAMAGEFAFLETVSVNDHGAFLDWGLPKDLFVPLKEQKSPLRKGDQALVFVYTDARDGRIVGTTRIERHLGLTSPDYAPGTPVTLLITAGTDLGYKAIVDNAHWGVLYRDEVFEKLSPGQTRQGFIKKVREDGKIDLSLHAPGYKKIGDIQGRILTALEKAGGFLPYTDKTDPELIRTAFGESKKSFKMAIGSLYREKKIVIGENGIRLLAKQEKPGSAPLHP
jgi:predicted RNA-binding protein (virulence factor B family)